MILTVRADFRCFRLDGALFLARFHVPLLVGTRLACTVANPAYNQQHRYDHQSDCHRLVLPFVVLFCYTSRALYGARRTLYNMYNGSVNTDCIKIFMAREIENPFAAQLRIRRGNTPQGVFAEQLGLKQAVYSHYENRRREPTLDELCRIARVLNVTPNDLLGFSAASSSGDVTHGTNSPIIKVNGNNNNIAPPPLSRSTSTSPSTPGGKIRKGNGKRK